MALQAEASLDGYIVTLTQKVPPDAGSRGKVTVTGSLTILSLDCRLSPIERSDPSASSVHITEAAPKAENAMNDRRSGKWQSVSTGAK